MTSLSISRSSPWQSRQAIFKLFPDSRGNHQSHSAAQQSSIARGTSKFASFDISEQLPPPKLSSPTLAQPQVLRYDFVVIGSGIAGLTYALKAADSGNVAIITKEAAREGCTTYAQGGVCAVLDPLDSVDIHSHDTMVAGAFLNDAQVVDIVCREGAERVLELVELGAQFTTCEDGSLHLTREGGHSQRRIVHATDATGAEIVRALLATTQNHPNIDIFENHIGTDLVIETLKNESTCFGVDVLDVKANSMMRFLSAATLLASGGAGQLYPSTTNPSVATGDGIAMAWRANAKVGNMEFIQFHPTALFNPDELGRCFLISEALRGEGGLLFNLDGHRFMPDYDARAELAPRDVVARAIHDQVTSRGETHVLLDISHRPAAEVLAHFPSIAAKCATLGIDITKDPIPVLPAQHYLCGGVQTGMYGETSVPGLFACGEVSYTGLHGANRLASNSLLEGLVFAHRAVRPSVVHAQHALTTRSGDIHEAGAKASFTGARAARELTPQLEEWVKKELGKLRSLMWRVAGIERTQSDLQSGMNVIAAISVEVEAMVAHYGVSRELVELQNLVTCGSLVVSSALSRTESRGLQFRKDYPASSTDLMMPTIIQLAPRPPVCLPVKPAPAMMQTKKGARGVLQPIARQREVGVRSMPIELD